MQSVSKRRQDKELPLMQSAFVGITILLTLLLGGASHSLAQTTHSVCASACDYTTIQDAIDNVLTVNGDTILVNVYGNHTESGILVSKSLTIQGCGVDVTTVQAASGSCENASDRVFTVYGESVDLTVTFENITISNGMADDDDGGGIYNAGETVYIQNARVSNNCAESDWLARHGDGGGHLQ